MKRQTCSHHAPDASVLMPVRNAENTIAAAIESIVSQTFTNWELVIIDDGSTDNTPSLLKNAAANDPRLKIHGTPPHGIAKALNHGISCCRAPWIARMDADDLMAPDRLACQLDHALKNPELGVVSGLVKHGGDPGGFALYVEWLNSLLSHEEIQIKRFIESPIAHPSVIFRRDLVKHYGGYLDGDFPEDYELWLRWIECGVKFGKVARHVVTWNDAPTRLTRSDPRYGVEKFYSTKLTYLTSWLRKNVDPKREIWLWGAGRISRKRFTKLADHGIPITGFIDIDPNKCGARRDNLKVVLADDMPARNESFIIAGVAKHGARALIQQDLETRGWKEGRDFIHAA